MQLHVPLLFPYSAADWPVGGTSGAAPQKRSLGREAQKSRGTVLTIHPCKDNFSFVAAHFLFLFYIKCYSVFSLPIPHWKIKKRTKENIK